VAELLTPERDDRRVDDGHHLLHVVEEETVEQHLVPVLEGSKVDVALEVVGLPLERLVGPPDLLVEGLDLRRKESVETEDVALAVRERGTLVEERVVEKLPPSEAGKWAEGSGLKRQDTTDRSGFGCVHQERRTARRQM
jgi:hypothetical protein